MTDSTFDLEVLSVLAARVDRKLKWAGFLLVAMLVILVIDLQMKRSIARLAVESADRCAKADSVCARTARLVTDLGRVVKDEREPLVEASGDADHAGGPGRAGVDGDAPDATADDHADSTVSSAQGAAPRSPRKRTPRNGPRAGGTAA